ncbi:MAG: c-type cytochrome, partial [Akkermansiaceae bacterium]|nr:c-type cytochrome [Akkermansiaceae bacterium]
PNTRLLAAIALGKAGNPADIPPLVALLEENADADPYLRHGAVRALQSIAEATGSAEALLEHAAHPSPAVRRGLVLTLRRLKHAGIATFLDDKEAGIVIETIQAINDAYIEGARPALARATSRLGKSAPMIDYRIINAIYRVGGEENIRRILGVAADSRYPDQVRMEALFVLQRWEDPPAADPTTGKHRPLDGDRSLAAHRPEIAKTLRDLLGSTSGDLLAEVIRTAEHFGIEIGPETLLAHFAEPKNATGLRLAALATLQKANSPQLREVLDRTIDDRDREIRARSFEALAALDPAAAVAQAGEILASDRTFDRQRALGVLAGIKDPGAAAIILSMLEDLGQQPPAIHLDILEAAAQRDEPGIATALAAYEKSLDPADPLAAYAVAIEGGDLDRGRSIFYNHGAAQCTRCHKGQRGRKGGVAGPDLRNVGNLHDRAYLLESLVNPGAHIAPGYGTVSLTLKDGTIVAGNLRKDDEKDVTLADLVSAEEKIYARADIAGISQPASTMPPVIGILKKTEMRDVVAYLASLKDARKE